MAEYPSAIVDPRAVVNKSGVEYDADKTSVLYAEDINYINEEVVAVETELGVEPKGDYDDVAAFLLDLLARAKTRFDEIISDATPTINTDEVDLFRITAQAVAITSMTTNLSGTPTHGNKLIIQITGTASRAITWGTGFESSGTVTLPATTSGTTMLSVGFVYNSATSKWTCVAVA